MCKDQEPRPRALHISDEEKKGTYNTLVEEKQKKVKCERERKVSDPNGQNQIAQAFSLPFFFLLLC
jgi:hypothetical protein